MRYLTYRIVLITVACIISITVSIPARAQQQSQSTIESELERIQQATVFIYQATDSQQTLSITCAGTGTLVKRTGLILTNAHFTSANRICNGNVIIVAISLDLNAPPVPLYRAEIVQVSERYDLAVLQITQELDGRQLVSDNLALPFVELANVNDIALDQTIAVVGYPSLGDSPISIERGTVTGFVAEPTRGEISWIKTSASIPGLMSGGGAYDSTGRLIGIPTIAPQSSEDGEGCRVLQDSNRDGLVNSNDFCVPEGGFINILRSVGFARTLVRAASLGLLVTDYSSSIRTPVIGESVEISRMFFSPSVNEDGMPSQVVSSLPTGTSRLYLFFDYANMTTETTYELRVNTDNIPNANFSLAPVRWSGEQNGMWHIGSIGRTLPNGVYDFTLFIDGVAQGSASIVVGGVQPPDPAFTDIVFGLSDEVGTPLGNGYVLPVGNTASARFIFRNMQQDSEWIARWFYEGAVIFRTPQDVWVQGADGVETISIQDPAGLPVGTYRLELYIDGLLTATSDFIIAGSREGAFPQAFRNTHFSTADSVEEAVNATEVSTLPTGTQVLYGLFDWQQIAINTTWSLEWYVDDELFFEQSGPWQIGNSGQNYITSVIGVDDTLPDGTYRIDLKIGSVLLGRTEAAIGIGQLPIDRFASASGLQLRGTIFDVDTGQGIPGVTFVLISEDFSVEDFIWDSSQIYSFATTDRNGFFQLDRPLEISTEDTPVPYSVVIRADGYLPIEADGFVVSEDNDNPLELTIYMTRE